MKIWVDTVVHQARDCAGRVVKRCVTVDVSIETMVRDGFDNVALAKLEMDLEAWLCQRLNTCFVKEEA